MVNLSPTSVAATSLQVIRSDLNVDRLYNEDAKTRRIGGLIRSAPWFLCAFAVLGRKVGSHAELHALPSMRRREDLSPEYFVLWALWLTPRELDFGCGGAAPGKLVSIRG